MVNDGQSWKWRLEQSYKYETLWNHIKPWLWNHKKNKGFDKYETMMSAFKRPQPVVMINQLSSWELQTRGSQEPQLKTMDEHLNKD